jgi:hypothetical protein
MHVQWKLTTIYVCVLYRRPSNSQPLADGKTAYFTRHIGNALFSTCEFFVCYVISMKSHLLTFSTCLLAASLKRTRNRRQEITFSFIKAVELQLCRSASSLEEYIDVPTLDRRLVEAAKQVAGRGVRAWTPKETQ